MFSPRPTWLEIDVDAIANNVRLLKSRIGAKTELMAVVKANAYGHGAVEVSRVALKNGATRLAVATWEEGAELREAGINVPVLILGVSTQDDLEALIYYDLTAGLGEIEVAEKLSQIARNYGKKVKVHINVDTGMSRMGVQVEKAFHLVTKITSFPDIILEGIFTHFTSSGEINKTSTYEQFGRFKQVLEKLKKQKINIPLTHVADSATLLDCPSLHLDMVRPGIAIYGSYPSENVKNRLPLQQISTLKTKIISLRKIPPGARVSYGGTFEAKRSTLVATLPIGYADGLPRVLSNRGQVLVKGKRVPIIGRICMDHCMIDVTDIPEVQVGDEAVLWGKQENEFISLNEVAKKIGTIVYEVVTMVDKKRVPRLFIKKKAGEKSCFKIRSSFPGY